MPGLSRLGEAQAPTVWLDGRDGTRASLCLHGATRKLGQFALFPPGQETPQAEACEEVAWFSGIAPHPSQANPTVMWLHVNVKHDPREREALRGSCCCGTCSEPLLSSGRRRDHHLPSNPYAAVTDSCAVFGQELSLSLLKWWPGRGVAPGGSPEDGHIPLSLFSTTSTMSPALRAISDRELFS